MNSFTTNGFQDCLRFSHTAMATVFEIFILESDSAYAEKAARAAFEELDRLERELSRFIPNSDISRVNHLQPGERIVVGHDAFHCIKNGIQLCHETGGAFDISIGPFKDKPESYTAEPTSALLNLTLDDRFKTVELTQGSIHLDLGGYGKGYAIDIMASTLLEWDISTAMLHGGYSTVLALSPPEGKDGWPVTISHPHTSEVLRTFQLCNQSLSGSGLRKGEHIVDPRRGCPATHILAAWTCVKSAARSDALSTAFMVMSNEERDIYLKSHPDVEAIIIENQ